MMTDRRHQRLEELFSQVVDLPDEERRRALGEACPDDADLRYEVEKLVAADRATTPERETEGSVLPGVPRTVEGRGSYRIVDELGRGGSGVVYLAERADGSFRRKVALKILLGRFGAADELLLRFRSEQRILAAFDHPNIARLLDAGTLPDGAPFLVMEYVEGEPIDDYVTARDLPVEARIRLLLAVCDAVQAAHEALVVHRDLKPSNVLVTTDGKPKLLDFGIAKLLDPEQAEWTLATTAEAGQPMTPRYASPEQLAGAAVTTATDVYGLGVLLYELLTERSPYRPDSQAIHHWLSAIGTQEPRRPSTAVGEPDSAAGDDAGAARRRRLLRRRLEGDLDHIVLKALRKEPKQRYGTAAELAADLRRHLDGLPVAARRGSFTYRAAKAVRRHALALAVVLLVLLGGLAFTAGLVRQVERTELERDKAQAVTDLLVSVFDVTGPGSGADRERTAGEILDQGLQRVRAGLDDQPEVKGPLLDAIGRVYNNLGLVGEAEGVLREALDLQRVRRREAPLDYAQTLNNLAVVLVARADFEQAEAMIRESLETTVAAVGEQDPLAISRLDGLQQVLAKAGRHDEAVDLARRLVDLRLRLLPASDPEAALESGAPADDLANLATALNTLGAAERQAGRYADAERRLQQALAIHREIVGPGHFIVGFDLNNLANVHSNRDRHAAALATRAEALAIAEPALGAAHPAVASIRLNQGYELHRLGRSEEGLAALGEAREALVAALGAGHPAVALADSYSALAMLGLGRAGEAVELQRQALDRHLEHHGAEHSDVARCRAALGEVLAAVGRHEDAAAQFRTAAEVFETTLGPEHPDTLDSRSRGTESLLVLGRTAEARRQLEPVVEALEARGDLPLRLAWARFRLARALASEVAAETRAAALAEQAEAAFREGADTAAAARVEAWLARYR